MLYCYDDVMIYPINIDHFTRKNLTSLKKVWSALIILEVVYDDDVNEDKSDLPKTVMRSLI